jgi:hypothetical protein
MILQASTTCKSYSGKNVDAFYACLLVLEDHYVFYAWYIK